MNLEFKIKQLETENYKLKQEIEELKSRLTQLEYALGEAVRRL